VRRLLLVIDTRWLALAYLLVALCSALALDFLVPPLSAPDEAAHLFHAAAIAEGQLLPTLAQDPPVIGGRIDAAILAFYELLEPAAEQKAQTPVEIANQV